MTKQDHINYWLNSAKKDRDVMNWLMKGKKYVYVLFFGHLYLEKICKALWVKNNKENYPPRIHNLIRILELANVPLEIADKEFLDLLNRFQIEGRYPDYINKLYKETTVFLTLGYINNINTIAKCLKEKVQSKS